MDGIEVVVIRFQEGRLSNMFPTFNTSLLISLALPVTSG